MAFYRDMGAMAADLLKPDIAGGLGQEQIVLVREETVVEPGQNDWDDDAVTVTTTRLPLRAAARGVSQDAIGRQITEGGPVIVATDIMVTAAVPELTPTVGTESAPDGTSRRTFVQIDGRAYSILSVEWLPAAGVKAAVRMIVR